MATTKDFHDYVLECLQQANDITTKRMMGEYCVYCRGKLIGDICDNTLLFKITPTSEKLLDSADKAYPYEGSKTLMLVVEDFENTELMTAVTEALYSELPEKKGKR